MKLTILFCFSLMFKIFCFNYHNFNKPIAAASYKAKITQSRVKNKKRRDINIKNSTELINGEYDIDDLLDEADSVEDSVEQEKIENTEIKDKQADDETLADYGVKSNEKDLGSDKQTTKEKEFKKFNSTKCQKDEDCLHGYCDESKNTCNCEVGYVTHYSLREEEYDDTLPGCNYAKKSRVVALALSLFTGIGLEHFYIGQGTKGQQKLYFFMFSIVFSIISNFMCQNEIVEIQKFFSIFTVIILLILINWWIFDVYQFYKNKFRDSNGIDLA